VIDGARIVIAGASCRLPGAENEAELKRVLNEGICTVRPRPSGRWFAEHLRHPDPQTPGASYTFAGGYLDAPYDFDMAAFGLSPREAIQIDPQQRLLAELAWEALEDARIPPSRLAGREVGVYVGVSALDHANLFAGDPGAIDTHFMTGNTLSIVANRISYLFDLKGPSFVVDTACSSSLVALDRACCDIASGRVDTAIVAGVNMLLSPASFVGFSRAQMLSPTGACRPFSDRADGYVRSEGGVCLIIQSADVVAPGSSRAGIIATAVNSDGRTSGIALPALEGQQALLERAYADCGVGADALAFIEAHGTGTAVGDPIEATAIGRAIAAKRDSPLPIGSIKSNIGHLEPASGLAGMMKALIALDQRELPKTLHLDRTNPRIDFAELNVMPAAQPVPLGDGVLHCGVSSFGFGGTNAHAVLRGKSAIARASKPATSDGVFTVSARCREALAALVDDYATRLEGGVNPRQLAAQVEAGRDLLRHRVALPVGDGEAMARALRGAFAHAGAKSDAMSVSEGSAPSGEIGVCFVYSGNGSQWAGMGRDAFAANSVFRASFEAVARQFEICGFPGVCDLLHAPDLDDRLHKASVAQPLLFAFQYAMTEALADHGFRPRFVLGHSIGEIAAAVSSGAIALPDATRILVARARSQERLHGEGGMVVLAASREQVHRLLRTLPDDDLSIAAENGPASITLSGSKTAIQRAIACAREMRIATRPLTIAYPYHSPMMDRIESEFRGMLGDVAISRPENAMFISTVTGVPMRDATLDADYWWTNIRQEVAFHQAIGSALEHGANLFVEIAPRSVLARTIAVIADARGASARTIHTGSQELQADPGIDPIAAIHAQAVANGLAPRQDAADHPRDRSIDLPTYPWQRRHLAYEPSAEALDLAGRRQRHPLIGARLTDGMTEWRNLLDSEKVPYLADHIVGGECLVPATALAEMILAAARDLWPDGPLRLDNFDVAEAMILPRGHQLEVSVRYGGTSNQFEVHARPRFASDRWTLHARGHAIQAGDYRPYAPAPEPAVPDPAAVEAIYANAVRSGIAYGPAFRLLAGLSRTGDAIIDSALHAPPPSPEWSMRNHVLHPASLDAAFHGLFDLVDEENGSGGEPKTWVPIRFERLTVWQDDPHVARATIRIDEDGPDLKLVSVWLYDDRHELVAHLAGGLLRALPRARVDADATLHQLHPIAATRIDSPARLMRRLISHFEETALAEPSDGWLLLHAHMRNAIAASLQGTVAVDGKVDVSGLLSQPGLNREAKRRLAAMIDEAIEAGLLVQTDADGLYALDGDAGDADLILATCLAEFPCASADIALAAHAASTLPALFAGNAVPAPPPALLQLAEEASLRFESVCQLATGCIAALLDDGGPPIHVAVVDRGIHALARQLAELIEPGRSGLTVVCENDAARERAAQRLPPRPGLDIVDRRQPGLRADLLFVGIDGEDVSEPSAMAGYVDLIRPGGMIVLLEQPAERLIDFHRGHAPQWAGSHQSDPAIHLAGCSVWFEQQCPASGLRIVLLETPGAGPAAVLGEGKGGTRLAKAITELPTNDGISSETALHRVWWTGPSPGDGCPAERIRSWILELQSWLAKLREGGGGKAWIVASGEREAGALRGFARAAMNEYPEIDLRFVAVEQGIALRNVAGALAELFEHPARDRELQIAHDGLYVLRLQSGAPDDRREPPGSLVLEQPRPGLLSGFTWAPACPDPPGPGEIVVEVLATGLNFRDVMMALGLLADDVLATAFEGAALGLEFSGRVQSTGEGVTRFAPGDLVCGLGSACFAQHLRVPEASVMRIPEGLAPEAAAALPVAFLTAWYALMDVARLREGERVLIHGGAGGVGLAAIQVALQCGAIPIVTVSTPAKEALARFYGAAHVLDSRSLDFSDIVRERYGGVDVVLNSLSGDAMRASLECLVPRGRFIELGKRDYVANTQVGLRPFRRNLSYQGVDVDQVLAIEPEMAQRGLAAIAAGFEAGQFLPLLTTVHRASEVGSAFRLMQSGHHLGKIVVTPPRSGESRSAPKKAFHPAPGVHLVVGGTRGLGLETALWLARQGAGPIILASRSGTLAPDSAERVEEMRASGAKIEVVALDVSQREPTEALVDRLVREHGVIGGVWHTAVHLEDGLIENLDEEGLARVLEPKVTGSENLHRATRDKQLGQFVLFSSAAALIGNPGQSAYCAANGYLEGLARARCAEGLPVLAVAWGAISDVGLLADRADTLESLQRVAGVRAMTSASALEQLGRILAVADGLADPVVVCADLAMDGAMMALPFVSSPTFAQPGKDRSAAIAATHGSLAKRIAGLEEADALRVVLDDLVADIAQILRLTPAEIDLEAPLDHLGMDSLMALELRMVIENRCDIELPIMTISAVGNLRELAVRLLGLVRDGNPIGGAALSDAEAALIRKHGVKDAPASATPKAEPAVSPLGG
jgi:phthiocerol/phenolphthiocerol synthesis type-I polyketide synthase C